MYANRNRAILAEINSQPFLKRGKVIAQNERKTTTVTSLGSIYSETLDEEIHIALKEREKPMLTPTAMRELGLIDLVEEKLLDFLHEFPLFHGYLAGDSKIHRTATITEDFSKGGKHLPKNIWDVQRHLLPTEIQEVVQSPRTFRDLATTCFLVDGKRRIGDFGEFILLNFDNLPVDKYKKNLDSYTLDIEIK